MNTSVNALLCFAFWVSCRKISSTCEFLQPKNSSMSPHCRLPVFDDSGGHLLFNSNILCCQKDRKGAMPVPFPIMITGTEASVGRWKDWALNKRKRGFSTRTVLVRSCPCQNQENKFSNSLSDITRYHVTTFQSFKPRGAHA